MTTDEGRSEGEDMSELIKRLQNHGNFGVTYSLTDSRQLTRESADLLEANAAEIAELRAENEQHMDIRSDMDCLLAWIASTLGVESEPHQTWQERLMERVGKLALAAVEQSEAGDELLEISGKPGTEERADLYSADTQSKGSPDAWL